MRIDYEESESARRQLQHDIEELNANLIQFEEELYESKNIQLDLLDQLKLCEDKLEAAEAKIVELLDQVDHIMKGLPTYIAHKRDKVDEALGQYINSKPEHAKLQIMFLRETEGVYQFGQKRVYVKIEKGNQILCRVGGGFMHIDEFIQQYTITEQEKIERRDVLQRFQCKSAVQKISSE